MKRSLCGLFLLAGVPLACSADPYVGYIYPAGIQAGTTNRLVVGGQALNGAQNFHFTKQGLRVLKIERVPGFSPPVWQQRRHLQKWLDGIAAGDRTEPQLPNDPHLDEWRTNPWWSALDTLDIGQLAIVEHDLYTPKNALQATPSLRQMVLVTVAADADAQPGWRSLVGYGAGGISAPRPFEVTSAPHAAEPLYIPPHRTQPEPTLADVRATNVVLDGQILPGSTDTFRLRLAAGRHYAFKVTARELQPYIGDAVPGFFNPILTLKNAHGDTVAVADDAERFRPDPILEYTTPKEDIYFLEIHDLLYRGRADFVYTISIGEADKPTKRVADGVVVKPGMVSKKKFTVDSPGPRILEVTARRKGSPLDAVLTLRKAAGGPVLGYWDDVTNTVFTGTVPQGECDPIGTCDFKEAGEYVAEVTDRTGHGGDDYVWWLDVRRPRPDFEAYSTRSTLPMVNGQGVKVLFRIRRKDGFTGNVTIEAPQDIRIQANVITSGVDEVTSYLTYKGTVGKEIQPIKIFASAVVDGQTVRHPVMPCDEYEQAFAWKHLVPAEEFLFRGFPPPKQQRKRGYESIKRPADHKPNPGKCTDCHGEKQLRQWLKEAS